MRSVYTVFGCHMLKLVEARDAGKDPTNHRAPPPSKNYLAHNVQRWRNKPSKDVDKVVSFLTSLWVGEKRIDLSVQWAYRQWFKENVNDMQKCRGKKDIAHLNSGKEEHISMLGMHPKLLV